MPQTVKLFELPILKEAPELIVMLLHDPISHELIIGSYCVPGEIVTLVAAVGTPPHQLVAVPQSFDIPSHVPVAFTVSVAAVLVADVHPLPVEDTTQEYVPVIETPYAEVVALFTIVLPLYH